MMRTNFRVGKEQIEVDVNSTREFYLSEETVINDCDCVDCFYFYNEFINKPSETLELIKSFGVALGKNLTNEPTGAWCVRSNNGKVVHIFQVYQVNGKLLSTNGESFECTNNENRLKMNVKFQQSAFSMIDIELTVDEIN